MKYRCDLHIHTCLSPCGSLDSSPLAVVSAAAEKGLKVIAVCDHNSALNCKTAMKAGKLMDILVIPGIEVATRDEAHILALFPSLGPALELGAELYRLLPPVPAGNGQGTQELDQVFVDLKGVILGEVDKFLAAGADIGIEEVVDFVHKAGGLVIPAHIDRPVFSVISQLGFLPDLPFDAVEIAGIKGMDLVPSLPRRYPVTASSDAHYPEAVGRRCTVVDAVTIMFSDLSRAVKEGQIAPSFQ